jgi:hypothetical protein
MEEQPETYETKTNFKDFLDILNHKIHKEISLYTVLVEVGKISFLSLSTSELSRVLLGFMYPVLQLNNQLARRISEAESLKLSEKSHEMLGLESSSSVFLFLSMVAEFIKYFYDTQNDNPAYIGFIQFCISFFQVNNNNNHKVISHESASITF